MIEATKKVLSRVMWMARGTATMVGLAVMLAVVLGVGTTALAAVPGDPFKLGQVNAVDALTRLTGTTNSALLKIDNDSKAPNATALELRTDPKKPPMKVNSAGKVENLHADLLDGRSASQFANGVGGTADDADRLDGRDSTSFADGTGGKANDSDKLDGLDSTAYFSGKTYTVRSDGTGPGGGFERSQIASCDPGDELLGGGGGVSIQPFAPDSGSLTFSRPSKFGPGGADAWIVQVVDDGAPSGIFAEGICADFPPLR